MNGTGALMVALLGAILVLGLLIRVGLGAAGMPGLLGFLLLGFGLRLGESAWGFVPEEGFVVLEFLGQLGVIALLFRVGLESHVGKLRDQLGRAGPIWISSVLVSGFAGYAAARWLIGLELVPSLFTAVAFTATSVGVSLGVWRDAGALGGDTGSLLVDTVELDDFSGVLLMAVLFSVAPALREGGGSDVVGPLLRSGGLVLLKAGAFLAATFAFARWMEEPLSRFLKRVLGSSQRIVVIVGIGFLVSAMAEWLGFSFAIGAFFAGLAFSRDPDSVKLDASLEEIYALLVPFFFIWLGFGLRPEVVGSAVMASGVLLIAAILGKVVGTWVASGPIVGWVGGLALGVSMVPRAEITMIVMERGRDLGDWAVPPRLYGAAVLVSLVTSSLFPVLTQRMLERFPRLGEAT